MRGVVAEPGWSIDRHWRMAMAPANAVASPADLARLSDWIDAQVPGTAAGALRRAGRLDMAAPERLHDKDIFFVTEISGEGAHILAFEGLATLCDVYLDETKILSTDNMFRRYEVEVALSGAHRLTLAFRALSTIFSARGPRAKWRTQLTPNQGARLARTTLLGQMPGWNPGIEAVGPWREASLLRADSRRAQNIRIRSRLDGARGKLDVSLEIAGAEAATLICGDDRAPMHVTPDGRIQGSLTIEDVRPWMPHTHGEPHLYAVAVEADGAVFDLGRTGFRNVSVSRGADGRDFCLRVNDRPIFCRGAVWTSASLVDLPGDAESCAPWLRLARDAHMNMIRISGVTAYETRRFYEVCDELGLLVWSDFMFANFDYPADDAFIESCRREAEDFLARTQGCPSLAVLCGGSEMRQQAAMMGLPLDSISLPLSERHLSEVSARLRPDAVYVENTPSGGPLPFSTSEGVTHYYGVGAYQRPLDDARRANVRFAAECLAFANVPQQETLDAHLPNVPPHHPRWKAAVPRDNRASWDFEDIREFYLRELFEVDPARLRRENLARWLDLSRAVSCEAMETTFAEWRRVGSTCHGALVWTFQDLTPGAGWGVVDSDGLPKPAYYALKRAFRPRQIILSDEGVDGLKLHVLNESDALLRARVELTLLQDGRQPVIRRETPVEIEPHGAAALWATEMIGAFFDTTYALRFGPPGHDATVARLIDAETDATLAEAFHFPLGRALRDEAIAFEGRLLQENGEWSLELQTPALLRYVHIERHPFAADDDWFHLAPGKARKIKLDARGTDAAPHVRVAALNSSFALSVSA